MNSQNAYPLSWPQSWPRIRWPVVSRFAAHSMDRVTAKLQNELRSLGVSRCVISTNVELRQDGLPYSNRRAPVDRGAAVYFYLKNQPRVLACDKWNRVEDNVYAIGMHVEALRGQARWGVGTVEQAFSGYTALPAPGSNGQAPWHQIIGVARDAPLPVIKAAYYAEAKRRHPDNGGSMESMQLLNEAWQNAQLAQR